ncbi:hypothetical protein IFM89_002432 [Coptis chinensis]|uniref:MLO-like protein n=1 Tax=Coptis chinensis TaxID=261450 RepID=A0A835IM18_9MAGN|nr:hypothetical protein IFM89_002432 [Coptis chinensis]
MVRGNGSHVRELDRTPTWAVAAVCAVIIIISIILEKVIHIVGEAFTKRRQRALFEALEKIKAELMVLGFISLILTIGQNYIVRICIPLSVADTMLPCALAKESEPSEGENNRRRLLWNERRSLAGGVDSNTFSCKKIRGWKEWERETLSQDYDFSSDPSRFRLTHETSFVKSHSSFWTRIPVLFYVYEFGFDSCFYGNKKVMLVRFFLGVGVQFMCSYVTLPLYALVTQMGSTMKRSIFDEQTSKALKKWHMKAVKKEGMAPTTRTLGGSPDSSPRSPGNPIQQLKTNGHSARSSTSDVQAEAAFPSTLKQDQGDGTREQRSHNQDQEMANRNKFTNANFLTDP